MTALWLCVVIIALALARVCWHLQAVTRTWCNQNPTEQDVDNVLQTMEEHHE
jgi:hypothetical protein